MMIEQRDIAGACPPSGSPPLRAEAPGAWVQSPAVPWGCSRVLGFSLTLLLIAATSSSIVAGTWWPALARSGGVFPTGANDTNVAAEVFRRLAMLLALVLLVLCLWSYLACALLHPGPIHLRWRERFDGATPWCQRGCGMPKPPEAHHCRTCRTCVDRMDHHCPWIGQCVGRGNHKPFMLFLGYTAAVGALLPGAGVDALYHALRTVLGEPLPPGTPEVPRLLRTAGTLAAAISGVFFLCLSVFFGIVLYRAARGETKLQVMARRTAQARAFGARLEEGAAAAYAAAEARPRAAPPPGGCCAQTLGSLRAESLGGSPPWQWGLPFAAPFPRRDALGDVGLPEALRGVH